MNSAFGVPPRGRAFPLSVLTGAVAAIVLTACGGGGGGGTTSTTTARSVPSTVSTNNNASTPKAPSATQTDDPKYAAVAGSEPMPSLSEPQAGSTAAVGNGYEGIYIRDFGDTVQLAFIGPDNSVLSQRGKSWFWGALDVRGQAWTFKSESVGTEDGTTLDSLIGSGTFETKSSMSGRYNFEGGVSNVWGPIKYTYENALAVDQSSVAGSWGVRDADGMSFTVDATGALKGKTTGTNYGVCELSGALVQREPGTKKNLYSLELKGVNAATGDQPACLIDKAPFKGSAFIGLVPAGKYNSNGYFRVLVGLVNTEGHARFMVALDRQR
ncbi:hypothetical protein QTH91_08930 [Variovorax dokdonensis]|uniref:Lipoprotein n=1 Tax=Variovorax dokdonensis TaxID=344883 RepID=A0ABT7N9I9_9BURK|nr:hypothetical protein [Variovorax dokdonensis]MDM0044602.1 hypothetical protein [Variovorax dokdonensis]